MDRLDTKANISSMTVSGDSYEACIEQIRNRFGTNYLILKKSVTPTGGFLGFGARERVTLEFVRTPNGAHSAINVAAPRSKIEDFESTRTKIVEQGQRLVGKDPQVEKMIKELDSIKTLINTVLASSQEKEHPTILRIVSLLEKNEFSPEYIQEIKNKLKQKFSLEQMESYEEIEAAVIEMIGKSIKIDDRPLRLSKLKVMVLVGPTGVGKTTTVAKLTANYKLRSILNNNQELRVRIITIDSFRIKAVAQIETLGEYMEVPVSVASNVEDIRKLINLHKDNTDVFLIDTIGYSPNAFDKIASMKGMLDARGFSFEYYLTMSATTKYSDMREIMQQFEPFNYESIIFTKIDETTMIGNVFSILAEKHKSLAFITDGQSVPQNILRGSAISLLKRLNDFSIDRESLENMFPPEQPLR